MAIQRLSTRVQRSRVLQSADNAGPPLSQLIAHGPYQKPIPRLSPWAARSSLHEPNFSPSAFSSSCAALQSIPRRQFSYASARAAPGDDGYSPAGRGASLPTDDASPQANGTSSARRSRTDSTYSPPGPRQGPRGPPQIPGLEGSWKRATLLRWFARKRSFAPGDVYTPTDLSARPLDAARPKPKRPTRDVLDVVGVDIVDEYKVRWSIPDYCEPPECLAAGLFVGMFGL